MEKLEKVIKGLECCAVGAECDHCHYASMNNGGFQGCYQMHQDALALLKAQEARHRLEIHNIGNVDVPEGVTWEQFQAVMSGVVKALEHTDRGESWPYDEDRR